jgi:NAD(P)H dehydrogenase (quinone)
VTAIAVTGATGRLGGRVARLLEQAGVSPRLLVRDLSRAPRLAGAEAVRASYSDADAVTAALKGVDTVLMVSASESAVRVDQHRTFIDAAARAGVKHLVYTSFFGANPTATFTLARDHWATEEHIRASGLAYTFVRDNMYADFLPALVGPDNVLRGPAGNGRVAAVVENDVAEVVARVLEKPGAHRGATYDLTGPEGLTLDQVATTITAVTGRPVVYHPETLEEAYASRASFGVPDWQVEAWVSTYAAIAAGELDGVSTAVATITGHPATAFADLLRREQARSRPHP